MVPRPYILDDPEDDTGRFEEVPEHECCVCKSRFNANSGGVECPEGLSEVYCPDCVKDGSHIACITDYCTTVDNTGHEAERLIKTLKPI